MKKFRAGLLLMLAIVLAASNAFAARKAPIRVPDVEAALGGGLIRITPTPAPVRDPASICKAIGHSWEQTSKQNPTCAKDGYIKYQCSVCGITKEETLEATGDHNLDNYKTVRATCTESGAHQMKCDGCGWITADVVYPPLGHDWKTEETAATCTSAGQKTVYCTRCNEKTVTNIPATGHSFTEWKVASQPNCVEGGVAGRICTKCNHKETKTSPAKGHSYGTWVTSSEPTCDKDGVSTRTCKACKNMEKKTVPAAGHKWKDGTVIKAATCTEDGKAASICSVCNKSDNARTVPALGHNYGSATVTKAATCTAEGESKQTCKTCGAVKTGKVKAAGHNYGDWKVTKEATTSAEGTQERTCKTCGAAETKAIPKKGTVTPKPTKTPKPTNTPKPEKASGSSVSTAKSKGKSSGSNYNYDAADGEIEIYTTSGKVNLRTGPGKKNGTAGQVAKKNTKLGALIDAQVDNSGTVWYKVRYKNKNVWITSDYARAVIGDMSYSDDRHVGVDSKDLSDICFSYISEAADHYGIELDMSGEASDDALTVGGASEFVEYIELTGEGYALYGIEVGDKLKTVENAMKRNGLYCSSKGGSVYVYRRPIQPYSMCVCDEGFDSYIEVMLDDSKCVESISWNAYTE